MSLWVVATIVAYFVVVLLFVFSLARSGRGN
jgi:hypothetical protein